MTISADKYNLTPGQWVVFIKDDAEDPNKVSSPYRIIYKKKDLGCCLVMNDEGRFVEYCPRLNLMNKENLPFQHTVKVLTKEEAQEILGVNNLNFLEFKASKYSYKAKL